MYSCSTKTSTQVVINIFRQLHFCINKGDLKKVCFVHTVIDLGLRRYLGTLKFDNNESVESEIFHFVINQKGRY